MIEFVLKVLVAAALAVLLKAGGTLSGHQIAWWLAAAVGLVVVFGGMLIIDADEDWWK